MLFHPCSVCSRVLYHGPVQEVLPHFSTLGFDCPSRKEPPSFLQASRAVGSMGCCCAACFRGGVPVSCALSRPASCRQVSLPIAVVGSLERACPNEVMAGGLRGHATSSAAQQAQQAATWRL